MTKKAKNQETTQTPVHKPTTGADLVRLREQLGLRTHSLSWLIGAPMGVLGTLSHRPNQRRPLSLTRALTVRLLSAYPEASPLPESWTPAQLYDLLSQIDPHIKAKELGILLGRQGGSGYRWLHDYNGSGVSSQVDALITAIRYFLADAEGHPRDDAPERLKALREMVRAEASARGCDLDVLENLHRWTCAQAGGDDD